MNLRILAFRSAALPLGVLCGLGGPAAGAADWQSLTDNSPFGTVAGAAPGSPDQLEFRGVVQEEGVYLVNLFNPVTKTSQWIPVHGQVPGLEVRGYDAGADKVEVSQGGKALTLSLKQSRVTLAQPAPPAVPAPENGEGARGERPGEGREGMRGRSGPGNGGDSPMVRNLPPEAQAMIQEFRRRRSERMNQQANEAQPSTPAARPR